MYTHFFLPSRDFDSGQEEHTRIIKHDTRGLD